MIAWILRAFFTAELSAILLLATYGTGAALAQSADNIVELNRQVFQLLKARKYAEALPLGQRALALAEERHGRNHPTVAASATNLAEVYRQLSRDAEAEPLYKRALTIRESALGHDRALVGASLVDLARVLRNQGRSAEATPLYERAYVIAEKTYGPESPNLAAWLIRNLALQYRQQRRFADAERLYQRCLAIFEKAHGPDDLKVASTLYVMAEVKRQQSLEADAEPFAKRALAIREKALGASHVLVGSSLQQLTAIYSEQKRHTDAEPLLARALAISEKGSVDQLGGSDSLELAQSLSQMAFAYERKRRYAEAEQLYKRSVAIYEKLLGADSPDVIINLYRLATLVRTQQDWAKGAEYLQQSTDLIIRRTRRGSEVVGATFTGKTKSDADTFFNHFWGFVRVNYRLAESGKAQLQDLAAATFKAAQWALRSEAAASLAKMSARQATGDSALARLARERQDLVGEWLSRDKALIAVHTMSPGEREAAAEADVAGRLKAIEARITEIDSTLAAKFPDYAALASPEPLTVAEVQTYLHSEEALLFVFDPRRIERSEEIYLWAITKTQVRWVRLDAGIGQRVSKLRCGLDSASWEGDGAKKCQDALGMAPHTETVSMAGKDVPVQVLPFSLQAAHELHQAIFRSVQDLVDGKDLLIVPSGPLTTLPFNLLVTAPPKTTIPAKLAEYRDAAWLGTKTALTVLPSVTSLQALRRFANSSRRAKKPYLGIGNPLLDGPQTHAQWSAYYQKQAATARARQHCTTDVAALPQIAVARGRRSSPQFGAIFRGAHADIEQVRAFSPLPETADELCDVGRLFRAAPSDIVLGERATETALKMLSETNRLSDYAILHFATHGALTGQVQGAAEPGLVLTPPAKGTSDAKALERDDGFLTASEIAALKINADWVILSACNTAGGGESDEMLSGMARAFFYAGARALLVSHWEVSSDAAVKLTTRAFAALDANPKIGRAEALRRSMRELIETGSAADAHPSAWAPFVVVGEGAR